MAELSIMQKRIYEYIASCIQQQGYPPSVREIGEAVGLKSPSTVHFHLKHLEEAGMIEKGAGKGRAITLTAPAVPEDKVPIVGNVAAGSPILAQECIEDYLTFDTGGRSGEFFALRVRGESMLNAGILPGDLVVVSSETAPVMKAVGVFYVLPMVLFFLGYWLGDVMWHLGALVGCLGFAGGIALAVAYDRVFAKKNPITYTITGFAGDALLKSLKKGDNHID